MNAELLSENELRREFEIRKFSFPHNVIPQGLSGSMHRRL
jgi:hypothetical protein